jgi:TatD DNase family protein
MYYIDIHTHKLNNDNGIISILDIRFCHDNFICPINYPYSIGLHPWDIRKMYEIKLLDKIRQDNNLFAFGESGLDKTIKTPFLIQKAFFIKHIELSEKFQKPLIIHCVKSFNEITKLKKEFNPTQKWIIHGFAGSPQMGKQLIDAGFILSFGKFLFFEDRKSDNFFSMVPDESFFLETDESDKNIEDIYLQASEIKKIPVEELKDIIYNNFMNVFNPKL